ncbi:hypothetical protein FLAN108750_02765 [Flavobacterium antarcticum]|uniref:hypothetical protein n=1 Tax=Flavobacterium antarcticum TaxID=271155 RepID=UPI0003B2F91A|nr:hypothetical protein [Flavobacterium antarcticum]
MYCVVGLFIFAMMQQIKKLCDFYIHASIHVSMSVLALVLMTNHMFQKSFDLPMAGFAFFGTLFGYNFVKYEVYFRNKLPIRKGLQPILMMSLFALVASAYFFFYLKFKTQITAVVFFGLTFLYTVPVFSTKKNMRNWTGIKIYIVAFCWAGVTTLLPMMNFGIDQYQDIFIKFCQRFLLVIVLILIFEIIDSKYDDPSLFTVPQKIGIAKTKWLGFLLLIPFYFLEFFKIEIDNNQLIANVILVAVTSAFLFFANENRNRYYTTFWVESIPIFWLGLLIGFQLLT